MHISANAILTCGLLAIGHHAQAELLWQDNSISLLYGEHYRMDYSLSSSDNIRQVVTLEHASGHSWGDVFAFMDTLHSTDQSDEVYGEVHGRLSWNKLSGHAVSWGPIQDVLLAAGLESTHYDDPDKITPAGGSFTNLLYGLSIDIDAPGFKYLQLTAYKANNQDWQNDEMLTLSWGLPFSLGNTLWLYDGFVDWSGPADDHHESCNFTSQLKLDLGAFWGSKGKLYAGIEYVYWNNKFDVADGKFGLNTNERNVNALIKYHF